MVCFKHPLAEFRQDCLLNYLCIMSQSQGMVVNGVIIILISFSYNNNNHRHNLLIQQQIHRVGPLRSNSKLGLLNYQIQCLSQAGPPTRKSKASSCRETSFGPNENQSHRRDFPAAPLGAHQMTCISPYTHKNNLISSNTIIIYSTYIYIYVYKRTLTF